MQREEELELGCSWRQLGREAGLHPLGDLLGLLSSVGTPLGALVQKWLRPLHGAPGKCFFWGGGEKVVAVGGTLCANHGFFLWCRGGAPVAAHALPDDGIYTVAQTL
jgi:hypothetical protein